MSDVVPDARVFSPLLVDLGRRMLAVTSEQDAIEAALQIVCDTLGWRCGGSWVPRDGAMAHGGALYAADDKAKTFLEASAHITFHPGEGLIGRVWQTGAAAWVDDVTSEAGYVRTTAAADAGLTTCYAMPVPTGSEELILEFFPPHGEDPSSLAPLLDAAGLQLAGVVRLLRMRERMAQMAGQYFSFTEGLPVGVMVVTPDGKPVYANAEASRLLGRDLSPSSASLFTEIYPAYVAGTDDPYPMESRPLARVMNGEASAHAEDMEIRRPDGTVTVFESVAAPIPGDDGTPAFAVGVFWDIGKRYAAEHELARSMKDLESFATVASHDLQEPLRNIASYLTLLERELGDSLGDDAREFLGFALSGATRMQALISDLLTYARIGSRGARFEQIESGAALDDALSLLDSSIRETGAEIRRGALPVVFADRTQLMQLFQNLISNAIRYRSEQPPVIEIDAESVADTLRFRVSDNGIGIPARFCEKIFGIFQRLHASSEGKGTGIGLAIAKRIVERHGGTIWVESEEGSGSTFFFTLRPVTE